MLMDRIIFIIFFRVKDLCVLHNLNWKTRIYCPAKHIVEQPPVGRV